MLPEQVGTVLADGMLKYDPDGVSPNIDELEMNSREDVLQELERVTGVLKELATRVDASEIQRRKNMTDPEVACLCPCEVLLCSHCSCMQVQIRSRDVEDMAKNMLEELRDHQVRSNPMVLDLGATNRESALRRDNVKNIMVQFVNKDKKPEMRLTNENLKTLAKEIEKIMREMARREALAARNAGGGGPSNMGLYGYGGGAGGPADQSQQDELMRLMVLLLSVCFVCLSVFFFG